MCYAKPGPRCSSAAKATLYRLNQAVLDFSKSPQERDALRLQLQEAKRDYLTTPAGIARLKLRVAQHPYDEERKARLDYFLERRETLLAACKGQAEEAHAEETEPLPSILSSKLLPEDAPRKY